MMTNMIEAVLPLSNNAQVFLEHLEKVEHNQACHQSIHSHGRSDDAQTSAWPQTVISILSRRRIDSAAVVAIHITRGDKSRSANESRIDGWT